jgi:hypothetical protein
LWDLLNLEINVVARLLNDLFTSIVYSWCVHVIERWLSITTAGALIRE